MFYHEGHTAYGIKKNLVVIKNKANRKIPWIYCNKKQKSFKLINLKFIIRRGFWLIRLPFFYLAKKNGGLEIGMPNLYLWFIR